jgi:NADH:ubiquinone oxidoreductase subunit 2 (subunit N)
MTATSGLKICIIGLPLLGALIIWLVGAKHPRVQRWLAIIIFSLIGIAALALFSNSYYACILASGRPNCLFEGLTALVLFFFSLVWASVSLAVHTSRYSNKAGDYILMLLLLSAGAGIGLAENLLMLLIALNLFFYVIYHWLKMRGLKWRILILRDDYKDGT